jgi:hypothetical protein
MAFGSSNPQTYLTQWLEMATKGGVKAEFALMGHRVRFHCYKCSKVRTWPMPEGTTIDWTMQEWVKEHEHKNGGFTCWLCHKFIEGRSLTEHAVECVPDKLIPPTPVTCDFKPVLPVHRAKIDLKPEAEAKIKAAAATVEKQLSDDELIAKRVKQLQAESLVKQPKAVENALKIKQYQKMIADLESKVVTNHPAPVPVETSIMTTGRKFR